MMFSTPLTTRSQFFGKYLTSNSPNPSLTNTKTAFRNDDYKISPCIDEDHPWQKVCFLSVEILMGPLLLISVLTRVEYHAVEIRYWTKTADKINEEVVG